MTHLKTLLTGLLLSLAVPLAAAEGTPRTIRMEVNGLVCAFCAHGIQRTLASHPAATDVYVDLEQRLVAVALKDGADIPDAELERALTDAGYTLVAITRTTESLAALKAKHEDNDD